jgi:hypothetical protein
VEGADADCGSFDEHPERSRTPTRRRIRTDQGTLLVDPTIHLKRFRISTSSFHIPIVAGSVISFRTRKKKSIANRPDAPQDKPGMWRRMVKVVAEM